MKELIAHLEAQARTLTLYDYTGGDEQLRELSQWLGGYGVSVQVTEATDSTRENVAVLEEGDDIIGRCGIDELLAQLDFEHAFTDSETRQLPEMIRSLSSEITVQPSRSVKEMVRVSREFERRALREGAGELHAGFQRLSNLATADRTLEMYTTLASRGVDAYVYGYPDVTLDDVPFTVVKDDEYELARYWFLLYDGNGNPDRKAALLSEELSMPEQPIDTLPAQAGKGGTNSVYESFTTTDPPTVDDLFELARSTNGDIMTV